MIRRLVQEIAPGDPGREGLENASLGGAERRVSAARSGKFPAPAPDPHFEAAAASLPPELLERIEESRSSLLEAIGSPSDLTFVRSVGNLGDQLIFAGARRLLAGCPFREIALADVAAARGHTAVLSGGGAWCWPHHELLPRALTTLEDRFERVILFPTSFDVTVPDVRRALRRTRAIVFAREPESFDQIRQVCDARLALDAAFYFDYSGYRCAAAGLLSAFRTDAESARRGPLPPENRDISVDCDSLDEWLWTIARHATIQTDRAHVMIAAALLGRDVLYRPGRYHKVASLAAWALSGLPVRPDADASEPSDQVAGAIEAPGTTRSRLLDFARAHSAAHAKAGSGQPTVTAIILTRNRPERARAAIVSLRRFGGIPHRLLVLDNGSRPDAREDLERLVTAEPNADFLGWETNLGCGGGRQAAIARTTTEYLFFLDDDAEIFPGTIEALHEDLARHPEALASSARVALPDGSIQHCGGEIRDVKGALRFGLLGAGLPAEADLLSGPCDWIPGTAFLARREAFALHPLDLGMGAYYEDNEWCYRAGGGRPGTFRRCAESVVLHHQSPKDRTGHGPEEIARALPFLEAIARFHARHGRILEAVFGWVPELESCPEERRLAAARRFLELLLQRGSAWVREQWTEGRLSLLFSGDLSETGDSGSSPRELEFELHRIRTSRWWRTANIYWSAAQRFRGKKP